MYTYFGITLFLIYSIGMGLTVTKLPDSAPIPWWTFIILLTLALTGCLTRRRKSIFYAAALALAVNWAAVHFGYQFIYESVSFIANNQLFQFDPGPVVAGIFIIFGFVNLVGLVVYYRAVRNLSEMSQIEGENDNTSLFALLKKLLGLNQDEYKYLDTVLCMDTQTNKEVVLRGRDRMVSTAIVGTTGTGKTASVMVPMIRQDIDRLARGHKLAITVIEPTKDLTDRVAAMCEKLNVPYLYIDPTNPKTHRFNILQGEKEIAAEATRSVLSSLFGNQQAFFSQVQQTAGRNTVLLLKELFGNDVDILDVIRALRDPDKLQGYVNELKKQQGNTDLVQYFEFELLGDMREKYQQFAAGLRQQLEDIGGNAMLKRVMSKPSDVDLDKHLREGGVLIINTAMGDLLKKLSEVFGQYLLIHIIYALFRKPKQYWSVPHAFYIDELPKYLAPDVGFDDLLAIGRKYGNMATFAMQSTSQLTLKLGSKEATRVILSNARSKIVFGGMDAEDARYFEKEFGEKEIETKQATYDNKVVLPVLWAKSYRTTRMKEPRYPFTKLMELEEYQFIYRILENARLQPPRQGKGILVNIDKLAPPKEPLKLNLTRLKAGATSSLKPLKERMVRKDEAPVPSTLKLRRLNHPHVYYQPPKQQTKKPPIKKPDTEKEFDKELVTQQLNEVKTQPQNTTQKKATPNQKSTQKPKQAPTEPKKRPKKKTKDNFWNS